MDLLPDLIDLYDRTEYLEFVLIKGFVTNISVS